MKFKIHHEFPETDQKSKIREGFDYIPDTHFLRTNFLRGNSIFKNFFSFLGTGFLIGLSSLTGTKASAKNLPYIDNTGSVTIYRDEKHAEAQRKIVASLLNNSLKDNDPIPIGYASESSFVNEVMEEFLTPEENYIKGIAGIRQRPTRTFRLPRSTSRRSFWNTKNTEPIPEASKNFRVTRRTPIFYLPEDYLVSLEVSDGTIIIQDFKDEVFDKLNSIEQKLSKVDERNFFLTFSGILDGVLSSLIATGLMALVFRGKNKTSTENSSSIESNNLGLEGPGNVQSVSEDYLKMNYQVPQQMKDLFLLHKSLMAVCLQSTTNPSIQISDTQVENIKQSLMIQELLSFAHSINSENPQMAYNELEMAYNALLENMLKQLSNSMSPILNI
ncbi:MAG: hypothetical protein DWQ02_22495 [Bacteroidetes bacterium]|nr:MAG: hypothetical protein DWQ02_22495 [Bacteroidota bacterium]